MYRTAGYNDTLAKLARLAAGVTCYNSPVKNRFPGSARYHGKESRQLNVGNTTDMQSRDPVAGTWKGEVPHRYSCSVVLQVLVDAGCLLETTEASRIHAGRSTPAAAEPSSHLMTRMCRLCQYEPRQNSPEAALIVSHGRTACAHSFVSSLRRCCSRDPLGTEDLRVVKGARCARYFCWCTRKPKDNTNHHDIRFCRFYQR
jgi:hypothetical protein